MVCDIELTRHHEIVAVTIQNDDRQEEELLANPMPEINCSSNSTASEGR